MGDRAILSYVFVDGNQDLAMCLVATLQPGDRFDFDDIPPEIKIEVINEFEGQNFILSSEGIVGILETCPICDGSAVDAHGDECFNCEGFSLLVDFGRGLFPYRQ